MPSKVQPGSDFGRRLVELRQKRSITQVQLAEMIGSSQRAVSHYETVAEFPPGQVIIAIAKALHVSTDELLGLKPIRTRSPIAEDAETRRLWKKFQRVLELPEKDRRAVVRLVNSLSEARDAR